MSGRIINTNQLVDQRGPRPDDPVTTTTTLEALLNDEEEVTDTTTITVAQTEVQEDNDVPHSTGRGGLLTLGVNYRQFLACYSRSPH